MGGERTFQTPFSIDATHSQYFSSHVLQRCLRTSIDATRYSLNIYIPM